MFCIGLSFDVSKQMTIVGASELLNRDSIPILLPANYKKAVVRGDGHATAERDVGA